MIETDEIKLGLIKWVCTGLLLYISFVELEDKKLNGSINGIFLGIYEIFTYETLMMYLCLAANQAHLDNLDMANSKVCCWGAKMDLHWARLQDDKLNVQIN